MGLFDKKQSFSRQELKNVFRQDSGVIPKTGGRRFFEAQRTKISQESFSRKYGSDISKQDYRGAVRDLGMTKRRTTDRKERREIERKVNYLKRVGGTGR